MEMLKQVIKKYKIFFLVLVLILFLSIIISIPSLAKLKNRNTIYTVSSWDGSVATNYKKGDGTEENPYIISNGSEYAFFVEQLKKTNYEGVYFELSNDIVINEGIFNYDETEGLKYILEGKTYYVDEYSDEYYDNVEKNGESIGKVNISSMIDTFKGNLNGKSFTLYGIYITDSLNSNLGLIKNLEGTINDLYVSNSVMYGIGNVSGIAVNSNNATLTNIMYDGYVINKSKSKNNETELDPFSIQATNEEIQKTIKLPEFSIDCLIKSVKITGQYESTNDLEDTIKINGIEITNNSFEIDLGKSILNEITVSTISQLETTTINFSNLKYIIEYYDNVTAGIVSSSINSSMINIVNKANVYGNYMSSGIIGTSNGALNLTQSYNTGNIKSDLITSGIIGSIKNNTNHTVITNVYNRGTMTSSNSGAILGYVSDNTGIININNSININSSYAIYSAQNSTVNVVNSYSINGLTNYSGIVNGTFTQTTQETLTTKDFLTKNSYNEFVSIEDVKTNTSNVWIYEKGLLPILYIDNLNNPIANLNINKYSWNNLSSELNMLNVSTNITFSIDDISVINPAKQKYYYVTNSRVALTKEELNSLTTWVEYEDIVTIQQSGYYVIYAKIVDQDDNITYINTDILVLNTSGFKAEINFEDKTWENFSTELKELYINEIINLNIVAQNDLDFIANIQYYISDDILTEDELNSLTEWQQYTNYITITETGKYVVYAKIVDGQSNVKYINTDYLLYNGYNETLTLGNSDIEYNTNYITNKSTIKLYFEGNLEYIFKDGDTHNLIANILLPEGTIITLVDKKNNKVYKKTIDSNEDLYGYEQSCDGLTNCVKYATYGFNTFKQIGVANIVYYNESDNYNNLISNEKYVILIDFSNTNIVDNYYDLSFFVALKDSNNEFLYQTLNDTITKVNIYSTIDNNEITTLHTLNNDYNNQNIYYNSNSELGINFTDVITYSTMNNKNIINTKYESIKSGLSIKLYDIDGQVISKKYLDNLIFEFNEKEFFANENNEIIVNLGSVVSEGSKTLKIKTKTNSSDLSGGTYYLKIKDFISKDGYNYDSLSEKEIVIPIVVENVAPIISNYSFNVQMATDSRILNKNNKENLVSFNVTYSGELTEPNIRISLYEKTELTAYNQKYTLVDIAEYTADTLIFAENKKYFVDVTNPILNINLLSEKFNNNGYKYVFELYDGTKKISTIERYFIVK